MANSPQKPDYRTNKHFRAVKRAMLSSLKARGLLDKAHTDKVEEYMDFWVLRQELRDDVAARGLSVSDDRGRVTENRSVSLEIQVSRQMMAIFTALGFKAEEGGDAYDDDEL